MSESDATWCISVAGGYTYFWISAKRPGSGLDMVWMWNNQPLTYEHWYDQQPSSLNNDMCGAGKEAEGWQWNDITCTYTNKLTVCEFWHYFLPHFDNYSICKALQGFSDNQSINVYLPNTNISDNINVDNIKYGAPWEQCQKKEIIKW